MPSQEKKKNLSGVASLYSDVYARSWLHKTYGSNMLTPPNGTNNKWGACIPLKKWKCRKSDWSLWVSPSLKSFWGVTAYYLQACAEPVDQTIWDNEKLQCLKQGSAVADSLFKTSCSSTALNYTFHLNAVLKASCHPFQTVMNRVSLLQCIRQCFKYGRHQFKYSPCCCHWSKLM